jgi:hypothetical protein
MIQKEKQELMLKTAQKKYDKDIRVLSAEKNVLHFLTEELSVTYTCHNNGKIDERMRKRPKRKVAEPPKPTASPKPTMPAGRTSELSLYESEELTTAGRTSEPLHSKGSELKTEGRTSELSQSDNEELTTAGRTSPRTSPKKKPKKETFQVGDRVRSLYSDTTYTIMSVDNDTLVHVAEEGDLYGRIMTIADLVKIPKRKKLTK